MSRTQKGARMIKVLEFGLYAVVALSAAFTLAAFVDVMVCSMFGVAF